MKRPAGAPIVVALVGILSAVSGIAVGSTKGAGAVVTTATSSPNVTRVTSSFKPASQSSSSLTWTQPPKTVATIYWRITVTTPGGTCTSPTAVHVGQFEFLLNQTTDAGPISQSVDMGPNKTQTFPAIGSQTFGSVLLPGRYHLKTEMKDPYTTTPAADCAATVVKTELYVETVASA